MPLNDAFTAGVRPGGLTGSTEIRLLLCYLIKNTCPITVQELEQSLLQEELVNYFEIHSCLEDIVQQGLVTLTGGICNITEKGRKVAAELAYDLPRSVRERAMTAALRSQAWTKKAAAYNAEIQEKSDGHCVLRCTATGLEEEMFCLQLTTPDRMTAELVRRQFILQGSEIYRLLIEQLTTNPDGNT